MPFVEVLWKKDKLSKAKLIALRDQLPTIVSQHFSKIDKAHPVRTYEVEVKIIPASSLDLINPDLIITILARTEEIRAANGTKLAGNILDGLRAAGLGLPDDCMVEVILNNRFSTYNLD